MKERIISRLRESADIKLRFAKESVADVEEAASIIIKSLRAGGKILIFGNGGSAADSQHIAAEFVNRYSKERKALPALALTTDSSILTSVPNDGSFENVFSRQIEALGYKGDVAWGLTTSGKSENVLKAFKTAKAAGLRTIAFTGQDRSGVEKSAECCVSVPSKSTPRVQELHITLAHIVCELVEDALSAKKETVKKEQQKAES
ncbi:MAG: D-sedoheptulose 7-phosphate isomerase [Candidatus Dadabacteria bacterium]|jgi:D-sedoheptulose 7-phosphate isomerase|nr:MAG: D-sedoheptulose 7-phosphate isomerase [Candidatus Dadabacteria bacterium]